MTTDRFELVMGDAAVLDKETCLVWEQSPVSRTRTWWSAIEDCFQSEVGGRGGWRLPTIEELASLKDTVNTNPTLPSGHPFSNVQAYWYWSSTTNADYPTEAWTVYFGDGGVYPYGRGDRSNVWCVRGGQGHDAY